MTASTTRTLAPLSFHPLPLGAIKAAGWLKNQLRIQANGLSGHLDEFWPWISDSVWFGGGTGRIERAPYWLDGVLPLAWTLDDEALKAKARKYVTYIIDHQDESGWFGPESARTLGGDKVGPHWPEMIALKIMMQWHDVEPSDGLIKRMARSTRAIDALMDTRKFEKWDYARYGDLLLSLFWLYDRTGDSRLIETAKKIRAQGLDWDAHFDDFRYDWKIRPDQRLMQTHVVNNAMALKTPAVWSRISGSERDRRGIWKYLEVLEQYHGQFAGMWTGDEHYATKMPSQGTETCAVVECMYSLEVAMSILGDPALGDRLERIAYNMLPAPFTYDMNGRQYDQQANQVICAKTDDWIYSTNRGESNVFGLETHFGCCTADMHQGWPKFVSHLWMKTSDDGLVAIAYAPCDIETECRGTKVKVEVETHYPFREKINIRISCDTPTDFPVEIRIPAWAHRPTATIGGQSVEGVEPGQFCRIEQTWTGQNTIQLKLPMLPRAERRFNDAVAIDRGPLVYSLRIEEDWRQNGGHGDYPDWEAHPKTPWNYAIQINPDSPADDLEFEERPTSDEPFRPENAPIVAHAKGRRVPDWGLEHTAAAPPPRSPVKTDEPMEDIMLVPYGCERLRLTEIPTLES